MPYLDNTNVVVDLMKHIVALKNYIIVQCVLGTPHQHHHCKQVNQLFLRI